MAQTDTASRARAALRHQERKASDLMPSRWVYFQSDGTYDTAALCTHAQARALAPCGSLFVYGGDVYLTGTDVEFMAFDSVYGDVLPRLAAVPGNHEWMTGAVGYETYWLPRQPPASCTRIDTSQACASRHHYSCSLGNGWLGIFMDCGAAAGTAITPAALAQVDHWLTSHGSRNVIVFLHHARLSRGVHGNNVAMDSLWRACFGSQGLPRVSAWVAGHNHNMGIYSPRMQGSGPGADPPVSPPGSDGVQVFINGAGGKSLYPQDGSAIGTMPDVFADDAHYGLLQIELSDPNTAIFQHFSTGHTGMNSASPIGPTATVSC